LLKERLSALLTAYIAYEPDLNKFSVIQQTDAENMPINTMVAHCNFEQNKIFKQQLLRNKVFINRKPRELVIASDEGDEKKVIQSCLFMPILDEGETEQFIVLLSDERVFRFTEKQITAFSAISTTLSSGLSMLEAKEKEEAYIKSIANMTKEMAYVIAHSPSMILMFDHDSNILDANEKAIELLGLEGKDLSTVKYIEFFHPDDLFFKHEIESFFYHFDEKENPRIVRLRLKTVKYGYRWFEWMVFVFAENGEIVKRISIGTDVTEEIEHEKKMDFILNHDSMTELYNTNYLQSQMDMVLNHQAVFCAYVDIRDFRKINENYGHLIGDEFLVQFSARLKQNFMDMENAFVVRVSGDEFAVVVKSEPSNILSKRDNVLNILHTINSTPIQCSGTMVPFYLNVGYSYYPELANSPKDVFRFSELAMFETKKNPSIGFRRFDWKLYEKEFKFQELNDEVKKAMENEEFEMFYQPIIQLNSPNKVYAESLLRWQHPTKGLLTPAYFIDFVEKNGQIIEIGRMTFVRVCKFIREKEKTGFSVGAISFNLSVSSLQIPNEAEYYINQMKDYGIDASQIVIEITESLFFDKNYEVSQNLEKFRSFGIIVAIDDFGMKYSTLSMLENVAYDVIKVDMHFTKNLGDRNADLVVNMIRELCNYNNKRCIVEGVEEKWQLDELKRRGFSEFQGYYFSRPIPGEQLVGFYKKKIE
jgi:diguanylate cyclase (GGDEF)-like protein